MRLYILFSLALLPALVSADDDVDWRNFKAKYKKPYPDGSPEDSKRHGIFTKTKAKIDDFNKKSDQSFNLRMNRFGDMTDDEFNHCLMVKGMWLNFPVPKGDSSSYDWRDHKAVTKVKDMGDQCCASYAFTAAAMIESRNFIAGHPLVDFSPQNLIDCSGSNGCDSQGGYLLELAMNYVGMNGINYDSIYPYTGKADKCSFNDKKDYVTVDGDIVIPMDEGKMQATLKDHGPMAVGIYANSFEYRFYGQGVFYCPSCCTTKTFTEYLTAVGYGSEKIKDVPYDFWILKNAWGEDWGEQGYIKMARNRDNHCGVAAHAMILDNIIQPTTEKSPTTNPTTTNPTTTNPTTTNPTTTNPTTTNPTTTNPTTTQEPPTTKGASSLKLSHLAFACVLLLVAYL